ncbi:MAG: HU family DNA-binding protein [Bradymonadales bacterium]
MTKSELIKQLSEKFAIPQRRSRAIIDVICQSMTERLCEGEKIEIRGFGSFGVKDYEQRSSRNPKTGECIMVEAKRAVTFKAGKGLRELINADNA